MELSKPRKYAATREDVLVEQTLVEKAQEGEQWAIGKLYQDHVVQVRKLLLSILGPNSQIDDLTQDVFVQVFTSIRRFQGNSRFATWLHRIAVNVALSWLRQKKRTPFATDDTTAIPTAPQQERQAQVQAQLKELYGVLDSLSPKRRIAFILFEIDHRSLDEIAVITGSNVATIKSRIFFARKDIFKKAASRPVLKELMEDLTGDERK
ncbi:MAG: RNA polymerase sigma factor [Deltaproteobacteria bacterium]|nr:RNA polymerase sigma factor [Deltaproteobacteria bacterium]MBN2671692.1 RNA polymerase sigma factor [Deltaproteobacteria bacterium]